MTTRRSILAGAALLAAPTAVKAKARFDIVVFDSRYAESRRFAAVMQKAGAKALDVGEDIGNLWFGPLAELKGRQTICGLTTHSDFFISSSMGREKGLQLRYEGGHDARRPGPVAHQIGCARAAAALEGGGRDWGGALAHALLDDEPSKVRKAKAGAKTPRPPRAAGSLYSWILA